MHAGVDCILGIAGSGILRHSRESVVSAVQAHDIAVIRSIRLDFGHIAFFDVNPYSSGLARLPVVGSNVIRSVEHIAVQIEMAGQDGTATIAAGRGGLNEPAVVAGSDGTGFE